MKYRLVIFIFFPITLFGQVIDTVELKQFSFKASRWDVFLNGVNEQNIADSNISLLPIANLSDLLNQSGLSFVKSYGMGSLGTTSIRGGSANHTSVLWNGLNIGSPMNGLMDLALIPVQPNQIAQIELGGNGGLWGNGSIGGTIKIEDQLNLNEGFEAEMGTNVGSFENVGQQVILKYSTDKSAHSLHYTNQTAANNFKFQNPISEIQDSIENGNLQNAAFQLANVFYFGKLKLSAGTWYQRTTREIPKTFLESYATAVQRDNALRLSIEASRKFGKLNWVARGGWFDENQDFEDSKINLSAYNNFAKIIGETELTMVGKQSSINIGVNFTNEVARSGSYIMHQARTSTALFLSNKLTAFDEKITWSSTVRQPWVDSETQPTTYFSGLEFSIHPSTSIYANLSKTYRLPTLNDLYWNPGGNPNLLPETGLGQEIGIKSKDIKISKFLMVSHRSALYQRRVENWIAWVPNSGLWSPQNVLQVWSRGTETNSSLMASIANWNITGSVVTNYTLSTSEVEQFAGDNTFGMQLPYVPMYSGVGTLAIGYGFKSFAIKRIQAYYQYQYNGYRYTTLDNLNYLTPFEVSQAGIDIRIKIKKYSLYTGFRANNLFNETYQLVLNRPMPLQNFNFYLKLNYQSK